MDLRERLRLLKAAGVNRAREGAPTGSESGPGPGLRPGPATLGGLLHGYLTETPFGDAFYLERRYPLAHCRGPLPLGQIFSLPGAAWALLGRVPETVDMHRALFFDTETTGLAGGSGTHAFLVGLGFFQGDEFIVRQYFLRDYPEEEAMLEAVGQDLAPFDLLVSFNGKAFDWPLMETRYRLARRRVPLAGAPHLDLLHPARRLFKERLGACNLTNLEAQVLGVQRQGDVPGSLIPSLYFDYLRSGNIAPLADVIKHNQLDIVSLVSLANYLGQMVTDPFGPTPDGELVCGDDLFALGRLFEARGLLTQAIPCYETAGERGLFAVSEALRLRELARAYKRVKEHNRAVTLWGELIQGTGRLSLHPYIELAKYYEHIAHDYPSARHVTLQALQIAERRRSLSGLQGERAAQDWEAVQHRLQRLERRLSQAYPPSPPHIG